MAKSKLKKRKLMKKSPADSVSKTEKKLKKKKIRKSKVRSSDSESDSDPQTKVQTLLDPFSKEQLVNLVIDLALSDDPLFAIVKSTADQDISHRKIFVHGLGWDATTQTVEAIFRAYGEIEDLNVLIDRNTGKCRGYAFVTYKSRKAAKKVLKNPKIKIGNRLTSCQLAAEGPPAPGTAGIISHQHFSADYAHRKIYVSNVPPNASADKLRSFFEKFGEIESGPKGFDPVTEKCKGYAIFVYKTVEAAKKVLEEPYKTFEGNKLHCRKATEGKNKVAGGAASITTALQPVQPQMLAAVAAAQQVQNMAFLGQQAGIVNPVYGGDMLTNANFNALMGGYYGMLGGPLQGLGLGAYGASGPVEGGSGTGSGSRSGKGSVHHGLNYMYPSMQGGQTTSSLGNLARGSGGGYSPSLWNGKKEGWHLWW